MGVSSFTVVEVFMTQDPPFRDPLAGPIGGPMFTPPPAGPPVEEPSNPPPRDEPAPQRFSEPASQPPAAPVNRQDSPEYFVPAGHPPPESSRPDPMRFATGVALPVRGTAPGNGKARGMVTAAVVAFLVAFGVGIGIIIGTGGDSSSEPDPITAEEIYPGDEWALTVNGTKAHADKVNAWDHEDCSDVGGVEVTEILTDGGCEFGIEAAYERTDLGLTLMQRVFVLRDGDAAETAAEAVESARLGGMVDFRQELPDGVARSTAGASGRYLVVTFAVLVDHDDAVVEDAFRVFEFRHADTLATLAWR